MRNNFINIKNENLSLNNAKFSGNLTIGYFKKKLISLASKKQFSTPPFEEFVITPIKIWNGNFSAILRFQNEKLKEILFYWLDGDLAMSNGWDEIVRADLESDFVNISNMVKSEIKADPLENLQSKIWRFGWGEIQTWWEDRSYTVGIAVTFSIPQLQ